MKTWAWVVGALLVGVLLAAQGGGQGEGNPFVTGRVWNIAHQGGELVWPSNTLTAFRRASALGVDMLDMDMHATRDGALVLSHDDTLDRLTDRQGRIADLSLAKVLEADAGYRFSPDGGRSFPFRGQGVRVGQLSEVLGAFGGAHFTVEIKEVQPGLPAAFCGALRRAGVERRVIVASFSDEALQAFRRVCPEVMTSMTERELRPLVLLSKVGLAGLAPVPGRAAQVPVRAGGIEIVTPSFVRAMHRRGVAVQVWTINDVPEMRRLAQMGVDGIFTDRPDVLRDVLAGQVGAELPASPAGP